MSSRRVRATRDTNPLAARHRPRAARQAAGERRAQIVAVAIEVFSLKGYHETGTAEIAARVGVSEPALYRYFPSKHELYLGAIDSSAAELLGCWRGIVAASATPLEALVDLGRWYLAQLGREPKHLLLRARSVIETADPAVTARLREHFLETFELVRSLYRAACDQGLVDAVDVHARAWVFMALGALLDQTQLLGLRDQLDAATMVRIAGTIAPELTGVAATSSGPGGATDVSSAAGGAHARRGDR